MLQFASVTRRRLIGDEHGERGHRLGRHAAEPRLRLGTVALMAATGILVVSATFGVGRVGYASSAVGRPGVLAGSGPHRGTGHGLAAQQARC